jgi:hypothetical protein
MERSEKCSSASSKKKHHQISTMTSWELISGCKAGTHVDWKRELTEPSLTMVMLRCHEKSSFRVCDSSFLSHRMLQQAIFCAASCVNIFQQTEPRLQTPARSISSQGPIKLKTSKETAKSPVGLAWCTF